ncbi:MAG TPA: 4Fe-4S dicluster domain-containing protein, partial [Afifellaceae bacterium]|nr:4Fe-4S dicluster domain-containing protein [Afifellaceae bacterium]
MQTHFDDKQLADPLIQEANAILRKCVHCGFCTATCPTYVELGNELDSPRGRIYLIKDMLENDRPATGQVVTHIDRCLSCLSCMTTCPSGVNYMHLVDQARAHIEKTYRRSAADRLLRNMLSAILPYPARFRLALAGAFFARPLAPLFAAMGGPFARLAAMLRLAPGRFPARSNALPGSVFRIDGERRRGERRAKDRIARVALLTGCAQPVLDPGINDATIRL